MLSGIGSVPDLHRHIDNEAPAALDGQSSRLMSPIRHHEDEHQALKVY